MSKKKQTKASAKKPNNKKVGKDPHFIIEKSGVAYFKDRKLSLICKPSKKTLTPKYAGGYLWEVDYTVNLDSFKRVVTLMIANGAHIRYVGMTEEDFFSMGDTSIRIDGFEEVSTSEITKGSSLFGLLKKQ